MKLFFNFFIGQIFVKRYVGAVYKTPGGDLNNAASHSLNQLVVMRSKQDSPAKLPQALI